MSPKIKNLFPFTLTIFFSFTLFIFLPQYAVAENITINFDALPSVPNETIYRIVPSPYLGFSWRNFYYENKVNIYNPSGFAVAATSPSNLAYNGFDDGNTATISVATSSSFSTFNLYSAKITAAWCNNLVLTVKGYAANGTLIKSGNYNVSAANPTTITFNYTDVNRVQFSTSGGTPYAPYHSFVDQCNGSYWNPFGIDDISISTTTTAIKTPPSNLTATLANTGRVTLNWQDNSTGETGFEIERQATSTFYKIGTVGTNVTSYADDLTSTPLDFSQETYRVRGVFSGGNYSDYSNTVQVSNCLKISGNGPRKIVFMRGKGWNSSINDYMVQVSDIIDNGFKSIDPFKTYINEFSFYIDLHNIDQNLFTDDGNKYVSSSPVVTLSSCGTDAKEYIFLFGDSTHYYAWADGRVIFLNVPKLLTWPIPDPVSFVATHESGHSIGYLSDEYLAGVTGSPGYPDEINGYDLIGEEPASTNCSLNPSISYAYNDGTGLRLYGSVAEKGCNYLLTPLSYNTYYKPSANSIMNRARYNVRKFNIISCGYLISGIKEEIVDTFHAQTHWPECKQMADRGTVVPLFIPPPIIKPIRGNFETSFIQKLVASVLEGFNSLFGH